MKILNVILGVLFIYFVIVQYNDPDPALWMIVYAFTAIICLQGALGTPKGNYFYIIAVLCFVVLAGTKFSGVLEWMSAGNQSEIFGEMLGDKPYIEETREFFGLFIALAAIVFNWILARKKRLA